MAIVENGDAMPGDEEERAFRAIVDESVASLGAGPHTLGQLYSHFGLEEGTSLKRDAVTDRIGDRILAALQHSEPGGPSFLRLKRQLVLRELVDDQPAQPYLQVADVLGDRLRNGRVRPFADRAAWLAAVSLARDRVLVSPQTYAPDADLTRMRPTENAAAAAIRLLRREGFACNPLAGKAHVEPAELERLAEELDRLAREVGGLRLAGALFRAIQPHFDAKQQRHHLTREARQVPPFRPATVPWGYLLSLAAKHAREAGTPTDVRPSLVRLIELAVALAVTYDIEPYVVFELMFHVGPSLPSFLSRIALYDETFTLPQWRPRDAARIVRGLLVGANCLPGVSDLAVCDVVDAILVPDAPPGPRCLDVGDIASRSGQQRAVVDAVLGVVAHEAPSPNETYLLPDRYADATAWSRPLIRVGSDFHMVDRSCAGPAFYEALMGSARKRDEQADAAVGMRFETMVRAALAASGVAPRAGTYTRLDGVATDCDAVVETADTVVFLELKRKSLTRRARGGDQLAMWLDLAQSLLKAEAQASWHELTLRTDGFLVLTDASGESYTLQHAGRHVERVVLTLQDFGALQDKQVVRQIVQTSVHYEISGDAAHRDTLEKIRKSAKSLRDLWAQLGPLRSEREPTFSTWFLSLGHLLLVLEEVQGNESFKEALYVSRHMSMGTLDFYREHAYGLELRRIPTQV